LPENLHAACSTVGTERQAPQALAVAVADSEIQELDCYKVSILVASLHNMAA
jgi:hypothetical protein